MRAPKQHGRRPRGLRSTPASQGELAHRKFEGRSPAQGGGDADSGRLSDRFDDYAELKLSGNGLYADVHAAAAYEWRELVARLGRPFDRSRWLLPPMYPQYTYDPQSNAAEVSAALFQPPFFDPQADDAVNYGAVGTIVASKMIDAFNVSGAKYDSRGGLRDWLKPEELGASERRSAARSPIAIRRSSRCRRPSARQGAERRSAVGHRRARRSRSTLIMRSAAWAARVSRRTDRRPALLPRPGAKLARAFHRRCHPQPADTGQQRNPVDAGQRPAAECR